MILILIFAEALALYGLIGELHVSSMLQSWLWPCAASQIVGVSAVGIILASKAGKSA